jgi:hypothetical protein
LAELRLKSMANQGGTTNAEAPFGRISGRVVYLFAYDLAYDMTRERVTTLLGRPVTAFTYEPDPRGPREQFFYRPETVVLEEISMLGPRSGAGAPGGGGQVKVERTVKIFAVGAVSIRFSIDFEVDRLEDLAAFHGALLDGQPIWKHARQLAEEVKEELAPYYIQPVAEIRQEEAYTVFCLDAGPVLGAMDADAWLTANSERVAGLVTQETEGKRLSAQEVADTVGRFVSYYRQDLAVVDWDAALLIDEPALMEPTLHIIELANVQLAELEAYDRALDAELQKAYRDLVRSNSRARAKVLRRLRELMLDMARLSDELSNTTKFFGDWYLARVYRALSQRFYLEDWHRTIDGKLHTLDELYQMLKQDQVNRWMVGLEIAVVVLFVIEVAKMAW